MTSTIRHSPSKAFKQKHPVYYLSEGNAVVQAGNTLFCFDLSILHSKSLVLQSILPSTQPSHLPKFDDTHPLQLLETSSTDLERLLQILLPLPNSPLPNLSTPEHYLSLLNVASKYHIPTVTSLAAARLHTLPSPGLDPIRKIAIWDQYKLDPYLLRAPFTALCQREQPISLQMGLTLGVKRLTALAAAREMYRERVGCKSCGKRKGTSKKDKGKVAEEVVDELFYKVKPKAMSKLESRPMLAKIQAPAVSA
ncbi:hypothetical protein P691DRAFT_499111 [Macrolepiota fuliginosa MF-IS2]|uniref:BTB domain-containing protein n=1 Tax=Macrolepiota fuliginosa MF-IS2 TaxID=1400762 RepID=A0A9P6C6E3_9AGAR|nr:hypothetical protein P691DRAFT_499111 [Macrolepiota fuliginosa MF-IS2]